MKKLGATFTFAGLCVASLLLSSCASMSEQGDMMSGTPDYSGRLSSHIDTREKMVLVDPHVHAWGAYDSSGNLVKAGQATLGSDWCPDLGRPCHTGTGSYRVMSLGDQDCKSHIFPLPKGGAPMPYCMYFNHGQALHGVSENEVVDGNISHGCVRMHVADAEWLRFNFVNVGTRVQIKPY